MITSRFGIIFDYCIDKRLEQSVDIEDIISNSIIDIYRGNTELKKFEIKVTPIKKTDKLYATKFYDKQRNSFSSLTEKQLDDKLSSFGFGNLRFKYYLSFAIKGINDDNFLDYAKKTASDIYSALNGQDYILNMLMFSVSKNGWGKKVYSIKPETSGEIEELHKMLKDVFSQKKKRITSTS